MFSVFKTKPFDLESIFDSWKGAPRFNGSRKKDIPVEEWLNQIKAGCIQRGVPEGYWCKVAQHYMGPKAKARLDELQTVLAKIQGGKFRWTWKKFNIAMLNMGWSIDTAATETVKVSKSGFWFRKGQPEQPITAPATAPPRYNSSFWRKGNVDQVESLISPACAKPNPSREISDGYWLTRRIHKGEKKEDPHSSKPPATSSKIHSRIVSTARDRSKPPSSSSSPIPMTKSSSKSCSKEPSSHDNSDNDGVTITNAPVWLLDAMSALDTITSEHPKVMSIISAILVTAGSITTIPAISAGAGGAVLASGAAHAIGSAVVGIGHALGHSVKKSQERQEVQASTTVR